MNNVKFIILDYLAAKKFEILDWRRDFCDWSISSHSIWKVMPSRHLTEYNTLMLCTRIILNFSWWSLARLCCVWMLPNLCQRPVSALQNTTAWKYRKIRITKCESRFYPVLTKIRI